jgi:lytic cellulose monooxygenase (C1-hydroxylating)
VDDSASGDGTGAGWFKIYADTWAQNPSGSSGDDDYWGTKDMTTCCGRVDLVIPTDIAGGDYLMRAEALALHTAGSSGQAQFYMTCFQLTIDSDGDATPETVDFPGAYSASDKGILVNIHASMSTYIAPGPTVYAGGYEKSAGSPCEGCESTCTPGGSTGTAVTVQVAQQTGGGGSSGCTSGLYQQCGGIGFNGCTNCGVSGNALELMMSRMLTRTAVECQVRFARLVLFSVQSGIADFVRCDTLVEQFYDYTKKSHDGRAGLLFT